MSCSAVDNNSKDATVNVVNSKKILTEEPVLWFGWFVDLSRQPRRSDSSLRRCHAILVNSYRIKLESAGLFIDCSDRKRVTYLTPRAELLLAPFIFF